MKLPFSRAKVGAVVLAAAGIAKALGYITPELADAVMTIGGALGLWGIRAKQEETTQKIDAAAGRDNA